MMSELKERKHSTVLYGLWLEGAEWDPIDEVLVETSGVETQTRFPMICVNTQVSDNLDLEIAANNEENFDDNPQPTKRERKDAEVLAG